METAEIGRRLHDAGLRVTPVRQELIDIFASLGRWCTPQELYAAARAAGLRVGLATVYRLIEALTAVGLCKPFPHTDRVVRYVFCPSGHHHHLICVSCGRVVDVTDCRVAIPPTDFQVQEHVVDFFGLCAACRRRAPAGPDAPPARD